MPRVSSLYYEHRHGVAFLVASLPDRGHLMILLVYRIADFKRALFLSGVVGSWLVALNQGTAILEGVFDITLYLRIFLDYATPFTVSSCTSLELHESLEEQKR